jgi:GNAT superfamily N-acetyltransferase
MKRRREELESKIGYDFNYLDDKHNPFMLMYIQEEGKEVGAMKVNMRHERDDKVAYIERLYLDPKVQSKGYGTVIFDVMMKFLKEAEKINNSVSMSFIVKYYIHRFWR